MKTMRIRAVKLWAYILGITVMMSSNPVKNIYIQNFAKNVKCFIVTQDGGLAHARAMYNSHNSNK